MNLASVQQGIKKLPWFEYLIVVFLKILNAELCRVFANQVTYTYVTGFAKLKPGIIPQELKSILYSSAIQTDQ